MHGLSTACLAASIARLFHMLTSGHLPAQPALPHPRGTLHASPDLRAPPCADINYLDYVWRIIIGFGAIPCVLTIWLRCGPSVAPAGVAALAACHAMARARALLSLADAFGYQVVDAACVHITQWTFKLL